MNTQSYHQVQKQVKISHNKVLKSFYLPHDHRDPTILNDKHRLIHSPIWMEVYLTKQISNNPFMPVVDSYKIEGEYLNMKMHFIEGETLESFCSKPFKMNDLWTVLLQTYLAVGVLLRHGIVHADLHKNNIMITRMQSQSGMNLHYHYNDVDFYTRENRLRVTLIDFGFAYQPGVLKHPQQDKTLAGCNRNVNEKRKDLFRLCDYFSNLDRDLPIVYYNLVHHLCANDGTLPLNEVMKMTFHMFLDPLPQARTIFNLKKIN